MTVSQICEFHDDIRMVITRSGTETTQRPYNDEENAQADAKLLLKTNEEKLTTDVKSSIASLTTSVAALQVIANKADTDIGPADTKAVAQETREAARQLLRLTRLAIGAFETADV